MRNLYEILDGMRSRAACSLIGCSMTANFNAFGPASFAARIPETASSKANAGGARRYRMGFPRSCFLSCCNYIESIVEMQVFRVRRVRRPQLAEVTTRVRMSHLRGLRTKLMTPATGLIRKKAS